MLDEIVHNNLRARRIDGSNRYIREDGVVIWKYLNKEGYKETRGYSKDSTHYPVVKIDNKYCFIHRLVALAFIPNPDNKPYVDHINENKLDARVQNLRWCTPQENSSYYHEHPTRIEKREFLQSATEEHKKVLTLLHEAYTKIESLEKENLVLTQDLTVLKETKLIDKKKFEIYKEKELQKIKTRNENYKGYLDLSGKVYGDREAMIKATGKKIVVNGIKFPSAGKAATYIQDAEHLLNKERRHATISKELRRYLQGKKSSWVMYGRYTIGY